MLPLFFIKLSGQLINNMIKFKYKIKKYQEGVN